MSLSRRRQRLRRWLWVVGAAAIAGILAAVLIGSAGQSDVFRLPSRTALGRLSLRGRIVAIAKSQIGYQSEPSNSYCNKFSAYWIVGTQGCPSGERAEEWCSDFAAWVWRHAGVHFAVGTGPGEIDAAAISFYRWGIANDAWHPATPGYVAAPGDVAIYGLSLGSVPSAAHVAIVTVDPVGQQGPDVVNGDGDRTAYSAVESGTDEVQADARLSGSTLAGYVSPP